jgi:hypothetical protein
MSSERTSVGLHVHARTTMAWALDGETGEVFSERLDAETHNVLAWGWATLPQPAAVAHEAGPTGFVLARALDSIGLRCVVAAPSKIQRPAGDRIKTGKRDAQRLAKLLRMDELPWCGSRRWLKRPPGTSSEDATTCAGNWPGPATESPSCSCGKGGSGGAARAGPTSTTSAPQAAIRRRGHSVRLRQRI